ncbi:MAG: site-specific recombinase [Candidatus Methanoperedens nitroreducens]|uniref:Site-specific recombinase n=1 Tax=Candidatus Methanoperedens nitratireducens TaxID=1392998 RepID=A0A0P7ZCC1_9EURY|nr:tyrosine-type recombinase/integrase [Candidatus Methanoperedens sp. BLZ2]KAB2942422.1 MAG: tyrosine-type recombinase/integrase [Candidatus Methanoperedens sp.]KPQ41094.1 MAG: site-specific recombinase [Candidatus Methanoperedens sp. BLZ1]MBZ0176636.1 tyrosine-type recombinase/integrase [Candidatus Methanoperedens nitroreducens]MCX9080360.1 tyrosine-type recombinase/integrase [Candidatus Methanoperedens sp.]
MSQYLERFLLDCRAKNMTNHSIETYRSNVIEFLAYFPKPITVTNDDLRLYIGKLRLRKLAPGTLKGYMSAVASFFDFLVFEKEIQFNPVPEFRKRYLDRIKCHPETRQLISIMDMQLLYKTATHPLQKIIIILLAKTGIRRGELHDLKESDLNFQFHVIRIPMKAKRSHNLAFMDDELEGALKEYLEWRYKRTKTDWLLISGKGGRIHKDAYGMILADLGEKLHLHNSNGPLDRKLTPHCFRHWFTTHLFRAGMDPQYIKFLRGDSMRVESWQIYNRIDPEMVRIEYLRCIPKILSCR